MKSKNKQSLNKYVEAFKPYLLTLLYSAIFIALYLIYGGDDTYNDFIYNKL